MSDANGNETPSGRQRGENNAPIVLPASEDATAARAGLEEMPRRARSRIIVFGIVFFILAAFFASTFLEQKESPPETIIYPSPTSDIPCMSSNASVVAIVPTAYELEEANGWTIVESENFDDNQTDWALKNINDANKTITSEIRGGKYHYSLVMKGDAMGGWRSPQTESVSDFFLTAEFTRFDDSVSGDYGLVFRNNEGNSYYFGIEDEEFFVLVHTTKWYSDGVGLSDSGFAIGPTASLAIRPSGINRLSALGRGSRFTFLINDQLVAELTNECFQQGTASIALGFRQPFKQADFEIDNFELRAP